MNTEITANEIEGIVLKAVQKALQAAQHKFVDMDGFH